MISSKKQTWKPTNQPTNSNFSFFLFLTVVLSFFLSFFYYLIFFSIILSFFSFFFPQYFAMFVHSPFRCFLFFLKNFALFFISVSFYELINSLIIFFLSFFLSSEKNLSFSFFFFLYSCLLYLFFFFSFLSLCLISFKFSFLRPISSLFALCLFLLGLLIIFTLFFIVSDLFNAFFQRFFSNHHDLEFWGMWRTPSLTLLSDSLWLGVVVSVMFSSMCQIELFNHLLYLKIFNLIAVLEAI